MYKLQIVSAILYIALPLIFLIRLWKERGDDFFKWLLEVAFEGSYIFTLFLIAPWPMTYGLLFRYLLVFAFLVVAFKSFKNSKRMFDFRIEKLKKSAKNLFIIPVLGIFMTLAFLALNGVSCPINFVDLDFPLKGGKFCIIQGGSDQMINHHYSVPAQKFAIDIVQLNSLDTRMKKWNPKTVQDFNIFGSPLYSPCDGTIITSINQFLDLEPGTMEPEHPAGNYLAIARKASNIVIILAHLMKDSLLVKNGDIVQKGQLVARVGNSGNTTEPHLHIHAVKNDSEDFLFRGEGIPMKFNNRFLVRNDKITVP